MWCICGVHFQRGAIREKKSKKGFVGETETLLGHLSGGKWNWVIQGRCSGSTPICWVLKRRVRTNQHTHARTQSERNVSGENWPGTYDRGRQKHSLKTTGPSEPPDNCESFINTVAHGTLRLSAWGSRLPPYWFESFNPFQRGNKNCIWRLSSNTKKQTSKGTRAVLTQSAMVRKLKNF